MKSFMFILLLWVTAMIGTQLVKDYIDKDWEGLVPLALAIVIIWATGIVFMSVH